MVPAERVPRAVAVGSDPRAQLLRLGDQLLSRHRFQIFVHDASRD
jgi:hypothetical protein